MIIIKKLKEILNFNIMQENYSDSSELTLQWVLANLPQDEYEKVYDDYDWTIYIPKTEKAAAWLGVGTKWSTTYGKQSLNPEKIRELNRFNLLKNHGTFYVIINKNK